jgi:hypothetical protein
MSCSASIDALHYRNWLTVGRQIVVQKSTICLESRILSLWKRCQKGWKSKGKLLPKSECFEQSIMPIAGRRMPSVETLAAKQSLYYVIAIRLQRKKGRLKFDCWRLFGVHSERWAISNGAVCQVRNTSCQYCIKVFPEMTNVGRNSELLKNSCTRES